MDTVSSEIHRITWTYEITNAGRIKMSHQNNESKNVVTGLMSLVPRLSCK